ncbi:MAG: TspO/MBR family protein [Chitinophagaceae bacterium]
MSNAIKLIISIAIPLAVGALGSFFTTPEINGWYETIQKPGWNPPNYIFGPVWIFLYVLMGIALYIVWKSPADDSLKRRAWFLFVEQLIFNFAWSFIFFNQHNITGALADILVLWVFILLTIFAFARVSKLAAWLLVPYISWVTFAGVLNYSIWVLN